MKSAERVRKVCILTTVHPLFDTRIFHKEAKTLVQTGYNVTLIAQHEQDEVVDGVKIVALPKPRNRFVRIFGLAGEALRLALHQRADVYHIHDPELLPVAVLIRILTRKRIIFDIHENVPAQIRTKGWIPRFLRPILALLYRAIELPLLRVVDAVVLAEDSYFPLYKQRRYCLVLHNYPCLAPASPKRVANVPFRIVYVGGLSDQRGAISMLETASVLRDRGVDVEWMLVGSVQPRDLEAKMKEASNAHQGIKLVGALPFEEAQQAIRASDAGIAILKPTPNYIASLPTKMLEYMAASIPVVCSNFPLWRGIVEENNCGLCVDPLNTEESADAIEFLVGHPEETRTMGLNGRQAVEEKYNWETEADKLIALYERILS